MLRVLAGLPGLRHAPGEEGKLHYVTTPAGLKLYLTGDWSGLSPLPESRLLPFFAFGRSDEMVRADMRYFSDESGLGCCR